MKIGLDEEKARCTVHIEIMPSRSQSKKEETNTDVLLSAQPFGMLLALSHAGTKRGQQEDEAEKRGDDSRKFVCVT